MDDGQRPTRRRWRERVGDDDRGATTALLAVLLAGGVLIGAAAVVVDVGRLYVEREELQSGADAAALAIANRCQSEPLLCVQESATTAAEYANQNAQDGASAVTLICGSRIGLVRLDTCPAPAATDNNTACIGVPVDGLTYVQVRTATRLANGDLLLPPAFAQAMVNNEGYDGTRVGACARAAWGPAAAASGLAIGVSECRWEAMTAGGLPTDEHLIYMKDPKGEDPYSAACGDAKFAGPGNFGYLEADGDSTCLATKTVPTDWEGEQGADPEDCDEPLTPARTSGIALPVPIYDSAPKTGNGSYHVVGFAAFVVTGWSLGNKANEMPSNIALTSTAPRPAAAYCDNPALCVYGYFTSMRLSTGTPGVGPSFGLSVVNVVG